MIFETERLLLRNLQAKDFDGFFDLHSNPKVMEMIPAKTLNLEEAKEEFDKILNKHSSVESKVRIVAMVLKDEAEFIGLCGIIKLGNHKTEIGYRIRENHWQCGFGTEITKGLIQFLFEKGDQNILLADATKSNIGSNKILNKFMHKTGESFNEEDACIDVHYRIEKKDWLHHHIL